MFIIREVPSLFSEVFFFLAGLHVLWDPSSLTKDETRASCSGSLEP